MFSFILNSKKKMIFFSFVLFFFMSFCIQATAITKKQKKSFSALQQKLIKDGFDKNSIESLYKRPEVGFETRGVTAFAMHSEARLNYDQFLSKESIQNAKKYLKMHKTEFEKTEKKFGVDKTVITAIILVETRLGNVTGSTSILNTLSTMASLEDKVVRNILWIEIAESNKLNREDFDKWADRKSKWAYKELKAFLKYSTKEGIDPIGISGSYAGALGISQFMPSNILAYAQDGNQDGRIDLFNHADAIASIGSFLKHFGWRPEIDKEKAHKIIFRYNHSDYYVNTILELSRRLKG